MKRVRNDCKSEPCALLRRSISQGAISLLIPAGPLAAKDVNLSPPSMSHVPRESQYKIFQVPGFQRIPTQLKVWHGVFTSLEFLGIYPIFEVSGENTAESMVLTFNLKLECCLLRPSGVPSPSNYPHFQSYGPHWW